MSTKAKIQRRALSPQGAMAVEAWMRGARARLRYLGLLPPLAPGEVDNYSLRIVIADPSVSSEPLDFGDMDGEVKPVKRGRRPAKRGATVVNKVSNP